MGRHKPAQLSRPPVTLDAVTRRSLETVSRSRGADLSGLTPAPFFEVIVIYWQKIYLLDDLNDSRLCSDEARR